MTRRTRRLLILFVGLPGAFVLVALMCLFTVIAFSGNVEPVRARARADGIALTWAEAGRVVHPEHDQFIQELESLADRLVFHLPAILYYSSTIMFEGSSIDLRDQEQPIPENFVTIYCDPKWNPIPEIDDFLKRAGPSPIRMSVQPELYSKNTRNLNRIATWMTFQGVVKRSLQREDIQRLCDLADAVEVNHMSDLFSKITIIGCLREVLARHAGEFQNDVDLAHRLGVSIAMLQGDQDRMAEGQLISLNQALDRDPFDWARQSGISMIGFFEYPGVLRSYNRLGRVTLLKSRCDHLRALRSGVQPAAPALPRFNWGILVHPGELLEKGFYESLCYEFSQSAPWFARHVFGLQVMAEIISGNPLPRDPHGGGVLAYEANNGKILKVWSLGQDGRDNHGGGDDLVVTLDLPLSHPSLIELGLPESLTEQAAESTGEGQTP